MRKWLPLCCAALVAGVACKETGSTEQEMAVEQRDTTFRTFAEHVAAALGTWNDIRVFEQDSVTGAWHRVNGEFIPVTVDGKTPTEYVHDMASDRPMMLPTVVLVPGIQHGGDGQSAPYTVVGRMPATNPEVQWVFLVRQYWMKDTTQADFPKSPDMAAIGHHPRTGATAYTQFYDPQNPKSGEVVKAPFTPEGYAFWAPIAQQADAFLCQRCHVAGPFIHTAWINQVTVGEGAAKQPMVPSDPLGPFFFVESGPGELFEHWDWALKVSTGGGHLKNPANACTECHRVAPDDLGLNQNSTRYHGLDSAEHKPLAVRSDSFQTARFRAMYWMPPVDPAQIDFYAGQEAIPPSAWEQNYGESATEVNRLMWDTTAWKGAIQRGLAADVPRPPEPYQTILVDRPEQDQVSAGGTMWVLDSRMRANTDADLAQWQFVAKAPAGEHVMAAPVVYRRKSAVPGDMRYEVVFVGEPRSAASGGQWVSVQSDQTFPLKLGDHLGVVFTNGGGAGESAFIPYTIDDWARLERSDGTTWLREGSVTYRLVTDQAPTAGTTLTFTSDGADFRTYSFEFRNRL